MTCFIHPSKQQQRNCLKMKKGPMLVNNKNNIFKKKSINGKKLLDVTFNQVNCAMEKIKIEILDIITKEFSPFKEFTIKNGHDYLKLLS